MTRFDRSIRSSATTIEQADVVYKDEDAEKLVYAGTLNKLLTCLADHKVQGIIGCQILVLRLREILLTKRPFYNLKCDILSQKKKKKTN